MRRQGKEKLLQIIDILQGVHGQIEDLVRRDQYSSCATVLEESVQVALSVQAQLQEAGAGDGIPEDVETYLAWIDLLYAFFTQGSESLPEDLREVSPVELAAQPGLVLGNLRPKIEALPVQYEIVFFPYKASMWDSMESIYLAAREDPQCIPYVVPVPYYDKHMDDSLGELHYEGKQFPEEIPVFPYTMYDLEQHRPDAIVIHNLYDDTNFVTCIDRTYHSKNLKKYTDLLVFVPYFVTNGGLAEDFRELPGYYNVDYVITQGETQNSFYEPYHWGKLIPLGNPKFDRVINTEVKREDLPEEWKRALREKICFLNLSITGLLTYNDKMIRKLNQILDAFRDREETLLYRPHPLIEATVQAMRPELYESYMLFLQELQKLPNAILDRSAIPETAIALSDRYLGEITSSIVPLFVAAGKPVYLLNPETEEFDPQMSPSHYTVDAANVDGTAGEKIFGFLKERLQTLPAMRKLITLLQGISAGEYETFRKIPEMPASWESYVKRADGSRRKVVLYNTSLGEASLHEMAYLDKIRRALEIFKENRGEVTLLWRPNPARQEIPAVGVATEFWDAYRELLQEYRVEDWGILDESPDVDRAIFCADAYYGDPDSVADIFRREGKPVMLQNKEL